MSQISLILALFFISVAGRTQDFEFVAGDTLERTFEINDFTIAHTKIKNWDDESAIFVWEIITFNHPDGWEFSLCDFPFCYTGGETTGIMFPAAPLSEEAFLTVNVEATYPDTGFYQIAVWNSEWPEIKDTLTVKMIATPAFSVIPNQVENQNTIDVGYNLTWQKIVITNPTPKSYSSSIYNISGKSLMVFTLQPFEKIELPLLGDYAPFYIVQFHHPTEKPQVVKVPIR